VVTELSRRSLLRAAATLALFAAASALTRPRAAAPGDFDTWLLDLRAEALAKGISKGTLDKALGGLEPNARVIELDRKQPEFTQTFWRYMEPRITDERIAAGQVQLKNNAKILAKVEETYGVAPESLMAFWGLETNYGGYMGDYGVFEALATLAWDDRRAEFFRAELLNALEIVEEGHIWPEAMTGSWAGAMGHFQFLPSTFLAYAVDFDGDGRKDIWINTTDAFASAANFLVKSGWKAVVPWGYEVVMPKSFPWEQSGADNRQPVAHWQQLGVRLPGGGNLTQSQEKGAILLPAGWQGPAFVVLNNFFTTLRWNNSHLYAISVGHLADRIAGKGPLKARPPAEEERLSREEIEEMQGYLNALGYDTGKPDGKVGPMTRKALKAFQMANGYPADAYPTRAIIAAMKTMAG
jgi:membrane-bound lytic murein transglycosylase B